MIAQLIDRDLLLQTINPMIGALLAEAVDLETREPAAVTRAKSNDIGPQELRQAAEQLDEARKREVQRATQEEAGPAFIPPDAIVSLLQSAMETYFHDTGRVQRAEIRGAVQDDAPVTDESLRQESLPTDPSRGLFEKFSQTDPRWISSLVAKGFSKLRGRRPFNPQPAPPYRIANDARVVLVSDWGSGVPRAQRVGQMIRAALTAPDAANRQRHVIHLGDVYYSGWAREYDSNFLPYWPVRPGEQGSITSWCLNANHDMYSGGQAYYDYLLANPLFAPQARSSFFSLENDHWNILGLDTAYAEYDLYGDQAQWARARLAAAPRKKGMLLSHHQLFSAYEGGSPNVEQKLKPVLDANLVNAWFWGHEHRCAVYEPARGIAHPRLVGHGGVPVYASAGARPGVRYAYDESFDSGFEKFARFGFVVLDFNNDAIDVRYVNENGSPHYSEQLR